MRLRPVAALALLIALVGTVAAQQELKLAGYTSAEGKFKLQMPPDVKTAQKEVAHGDKKLTVHIVSAAVGKTGAVAISFNDYPEPIADNLRAAVVKKAAEGAAQKGKTVSDKEYTHGKEKLPGRETLVEAPKHFMRYRSILAGQRLYQIMVLGPKDFVTSKDADAVLDSFEVTK